MVIGIQAYSDLKYGCSDVGTDIRHAACSIGAAAVEDSPDSTHSPSRLNYHLREKALE